ncbi:MAG: lipase, class 2 [Solirubrobacterales bacterium]|nr:lipase, class 2 [Solirubrobacterales bacterium]
MTRRLLVLAALAVGLCAGAPAQAIPPFAQLWTMKPGIDPPGVNAKNCRPTAQHPSPVVLVHGTWMDRSISWNVIGPALALDGYCVFSLDYGNRGTQPIEQSTHEISAFIDQVLAQTGASRVSIVGHSQGGMSPRWIIKFLGGDTKIDDLVAIAPSNHGSPKGAFSSYAAQYGESPAAADQDAGSPFLTQLNAGDETPQPASGPPISYTNIATANDEIVTPSPTSQFLAGAPGEVTNVLLQDACPADQSEHILLTDDPVVLQWVQNALATPGPADPAFRPTCG